ncbi:MAG: hypothetical protein ACRCZF_05690 [Gemmataceae bacterium]
MMLALIVMLVHAVGPCFCYCVASSTAAATAAPATVAKPLLKKSCCHEGACPVAPKAPATPTKAPAKCPCLERALSAPVAIPETVTIGDDLGSFGVFFAAWIPAAGLDVSFSLLQGPVTEGPFLPRLTRTHVHHVMHC